MITVKVTVVNLHVQIYIDLLIQKYVMREIYQAK